MRMEENRIPDRLALLHDSGGVAVRCGVHDHAHEWMNTCNGGTFCWNVLGSEEYAERVPWRCTPAWHNGTHLSLSTQRWAQPEQPVVLDPLSGLLQQSRSTARLPESSLYLIMQSHRP